MSEQGQGGRNTGPDVSLGQSVALASSDKLQLRRVVLSYKYEVDRLYTEYLRIHGAHSKAAGELAQVLNQYNQIVEWLNASRLWRLFRCMARVWHRIRRRGPYQDFLKPIKVPTVVPLVGNKLGRPELPTITTLDYHAQPVAAEKTWEATQFLSFHYYNQIDRILARQPEGERRIFVQAPIIDWFVPLYQRPQHMALAMARQGYLVFYVTANTLGDRAQGFHEVAPNVFITNQPAHLLVEGALVSCYSTVATLLAWQAGVAKRVRERNNKILFEYIDHIDPEISFHTSNTLARQFAMVDDDHIDLALASAASLRAELEQKLSTPVAYVPNGVDVEHYEYVLVHDSAATVPPVMREVLQAGRPVVGYFGAMAPWLWYPMLNELARLRPDLSFVYLGPDYLGGSTKLDMLPNVYALGAVDYAVLPYHAQHFDIAIIPFKPGDIARTTSPLKLFEYFAMGKPVVVTAGMSECEQFGEVLTASSVEEYSSRIDEAMGRAGQQQWSERYRALARANTWDMRAAALKEAHERLFSRRITR